MSKELTPLEVSNQLKDFVLRFVENGLDRRVIHGSFDFIETALKALEIIRKLLAVDEKKREISFKTDNFPVVRIVFSGFDDNFEILKEVLGNE